MQRSFDAIDIPNFSLAGFQLTPPPEIEEQEGLELPPINGVIVIPGNIGFLNQFFSVILQATNVAPEGSDLVLRQAKAKIRLPAGKDELADSGDDPLRVAKVANKGRLKALPLEGTGADGQPSADIAPQATNQAEFLVEGRREGTHRVDFDISGDLYVPALGKTVAMTGAAAGVVQVKNPTFSIGLAHPKVVREGEEYAVFATVTNTSSSPANLFQLGLNTRSLSGARPAEDESGRRELERLDPGQAESFEFRLVAETTGEVRGTVFLADEGVNGNFLLTTGVGDTGIPLSPDTLVLPDTVDYLPQQSQLLFQSIRLLGQAYSLATAPGGSLPVDMPRVRKGFVFERALTLARAGLHMRFGETPLGALGTVAMDYLTPAASAEGESLEDKNRLAFDLLRRRADAGHDFSEALGGVLAQNLGGKSLAELQLAWAERYAGRREQVSFAVQAASGSPELRLTDGDGRSLGRLDPQAETSRDIPFAARLPLAAKDGPSGQLLLAPSGERYRFELSAGPDSRLRLSLLVPEADGMTQVVYPELDLPAGGSAYLEWQAGRPDYSLQVLPTGEPSHSLAPEQRIAVQDPPPRLLGVAQWGKGSVPAVTPTFLTGDPLGRMLGLLFSEPVERESAAEVQHYRVAENRVSAVSLQPDGRLAFVLLERPVGPFVERELELEGVRDLAGTPMGPVSAPIAGDPERGMGARFQGRVVTAAGEPIPFARVSYIQPLMYPVPEGGCAGQEDAADHVVSEYQADADGRFGIDYVLRAELPLGCPSNPDQWLNQNNPRATQNFKLEAADPETGELGKASARVHYDEQRMAFDLIIRGYGTIAGRVLEPDGTPVLGGEPGSDEALRVIARNVSTGETYLSWLDAEGSYAFPFSHTREDGRVFEAPRVAVGNVILHLVRPADGYSAVTTVNLEKAGAELEQDLVLLAPTAYGSVSGRVLEADGQTPAANVQVQIAGRVLTGVDLYQRSYGQGVIDSILTDAGGRFAFERIPSGDIQVRALRQSTYELVDAKAFVEAEQARELTLLFPGSGGAVRGLVRDALGQPVAGAKVAGGPTLTETDDQGEFEIKGLPLGRFTLMAQGPDYPALGKLEVDSLGPGEVQELVLTLEPVGSITGTLYQADGITPIPNQKVQLWKEPDVGVLAETHSLSDGQFRFENYPVGDYSLRAVRRSGDDGGMRFVSIRFAGDVQDADLSFRGLGEIRGRVVQSNGTPAVSDVVVSHKSWQIYTEADDQRTKLFRAFIESVKAQADEKTAEQIEQAMKEAGLSRPINEFYMLVDQAVPLRSDILGPKGEVTGAFRLPRVLAGPYTVAAFGAFLTPAEVRGEIPRTAEPEKRLVDVGDVVLEPATAQVKGTVYLPDGKTPAGPDLVVKLRSLDSSGSAMTARGAVRQPVLPEIEARTDPKGRFHFPLMLRGRFVLSVDTGAPDGEYRAKQAGDIRNAPVAAGEGVQALNVRLYGRAGGVAPAGETLTTNIRLQGAAGVRLQVVNAKGKPVPFAQVDLRTESLLDQDQEAEDFVAQRADKQGRIAFLPVTEGRFSIGARAPKSPARGRAQGLVPENPADGLEIPITLMLGAVTDASGRTVQAEFFGSVGGQVLKADGQPLDNPAQVSVEARGVELLATTLEEGRFEVKDVPGGPFAVRAYEPYTARRGEARGEIREDGERQDLEVQLVGLGSVSGSVTNYAGDRPVYGADLVLTPTGQYSGRTVTRSDKSGGYYLPGVPLGSYTVDVHDPETELRGQARGLLKRDGQRRTTDVRLQPSGQIRGRVLSAGGEQPVADAQVEILGPKTRSARSRRDGGFDSGAHLPLGDYRVTARTREDGARAQSSLNEDGQLLELDLPLAGLATVEGQVLDSAGEKPEPKAQVSLSGDSPFFGDPRTQFTGRDGRFRFERVPLGPVSLGVRSTLREPELGARAGGELTVPGQTLDFADGGPEGSPMALRLQPSGNIGGRVVMADGVTPAAGAVVALRGGRVRVGQQADAEGRFRFQALPLGDYRLSLRETASNALAHRTARIEENGQTIDYDPLTLDAADPQLLDLEPADGSTGVSPRSPIRARFSEPLDPASIHRGSLRVSAGGRAIDGEFRLSQDGTELVFSARRGLPDLQTVQLVLAGRQLGHDGEVRSPGITDLAGRSLPRDLVFHFTTSDATPPSLVKQYPAQGAGGLPVKTQVRLEFSEPVDPASVAKVVFTRDGKPEPGRLNEQPILGGKVLVFSPARPLKPNGSYRLRLQGPVRDLAGNPMAEPEIEVRFGTLDTRAPKIGALRLPKGLTPVSGKRVLLAVEVAASEDLAQVELYRNGQWIRTLEQAPFAHEVYLDPALGSAITLSAVAVDRNGNRSPQKLLPLKVQANRPPRVRIVAPRSGEISVGQTISLELAAEDDIGIRRLAYTVDGGKAGGLARSLDDPLSVEQGLPLTLPEGHPIGSRVQIQALAEDRLGELASSDPVQLEVVDRYPPRIRLEGVEHGQLVEPGAELELVLLARDAGGVGLISLAADGLVSLQEREAIEPAQLQVQRRFRIQVPADALGTQMLRLTARAVDAEGNGDLRQLDLGVADRVPPQVSLRVDRDQTQAEPGREIYVYLEASDEIGVSGFQIQVRDETLPREAFKPELKVRRGYSVKIPAAIPLGKVFKVTGIALDEAGNQGLATVELSAADLNPPGMEYLAPERGGEYLHGKTVPVQVKAKDPFGVARIKVSTSGAFEASQERSFERPATEQAAEFHFEVPADAPPGHEFRFRTETFDAAGNRSEHWSGQVRVKDLVPPRVVAIDPADGSRDLEPGLRIQVDIDEPLDRATVNAETFQLLDAEGEPVAADIGFHYYSGQPRLTPKEPLAMSASYKVLMAGVSDRFGNRLAQPFEAEFRIKDPDLQGPRVTEVMPSPNSEGVSLRPEMRVRFDESLHRPYDQAELIALLDDQDEMLEVQPSFRDSYREIRLEYNQRLKPGRRYRIRLLPVAGDAAGNPITGTDGQPFEHWEAEFTTGALSLVQPPPGEAVSENSRLRLKIRPSEGMEPASIEVRLNGKTLMPARAPGFETHCLTPRLVDAEAMHFEMRALDADGEEIARGRTQVALTPALYAEPGRLGLLAGQSGRLRLRLQPPPEQDLEIRLRVGDPAIFGLEREQLTLEAGQSEVTLELRGGQPGSTWLSVDSEVGSPTVTVSVADEGAGPRLVIGAGPGVAVNAAGAPPASLSTGRPLTLAVPTSASAAMRLGSRECLLAVGPGPALGLVQLPRSGRYRLLFPALQGAEPASAEPISSAPERITAVGSPEVAEQGLWALELEAKAEGEALLRLAAGEHSLGLPLAVGIQRASPSGVASAPLLLGASPHAALGQIRLAGDDQREIALQLFAEPVAAALTLAVTSADPALLTVEAPASIRQGEQGARIKLLPKRVGETRLLLQAGEQAFTLAVAIGSPEPRSPARVAQPSLLAVQPEPGPVRVLAAPVGIEFEAGP